MKIIFLFITFAFSMASSAQSIPKEKQLYMVNIFRWAKHAEDSLTDTIVLIKQDGSVTYNGEDNYMKLDIAAVTDGFNKFIEGEKIEKDPAYGDDLVDPAHDPETGEQALHITIVKLEDYLRDKDSFQYHAEYFKLIVLPIDKTPTDLYKYMDPGVVASLKKMLDE